MSDEKDIDAEFAAAVEAAAAAEAALADATTKTPKARKPKADTPVKAELSEQDIEEARAKAREEVRAELRKKAVAEVIAAEKEKLRREAAGETGDGWKDEIVNCTIDLAEHSDRITLDGNQYFHGHTYKVRRVVSDTLREIMQRSYQHQDQIEGKSLTDTLRRARNTRFNGSTGAVENSPQRAA